MNDQLAFGSSELARATLACFHDPVPVDLAGLPRNKDEWYEAVICPVCRRRRAVVSIAYPVTADPSTRLGV